MLDLGTFALAHHFQRACDGQHLEFAIFLNIFLIEETTLSLSGWISWILDLYIGFLCVTSCSDVMIMSDTHMRHVPCVRQSEIAIPMP